MKSINQHLKVIALFFSVLILFQGCVTVYKSANVTLEEAVKADTKVRVVKTNGEKVKYLRIEVLDDGRFYGVKRVNEEYYNLLIQQDEILRLNLKNRQISTILNITVPILLFVGLVSSLALDLDYSGE